MRIVATVEIILALLSFSLMLHLINGPNGITPPEIVISLVVLLMSGALILDAVQRNWSPE